ncbi:MAG TPA: hypothetical protein PKC76_08900 [Saprospiraceae bacterium]|nr:hypothetical protein [Saprospiraceae bacterium]HMP24236.1 hypothetical protein [Saprospiraceae bacterium]
MLPIISSCQDSPILLKHQISMSYDNTVLNHPLLFSSGVNIRYGRALLQQNAHKVSALGSFGFIHTPDIDTRLLFGIGGEYSISFFKRFGFALGLQANYILTALGYDVFEYNAEGEWENQGNLLHQFSPSMHVSLGVDLLCKAKFNVGLFLEMRLMRLNESYEERFFEGYVPTFSIGLKSNF